MQVARSDAVDILCITKYMTFMVLSCSKLPVELASNPFLTSSFDVVFRLISEISHVSCEGIEQWRAQGVICFSMQSMCIDIVPRRNTALGPVNYRQASLY